MGSRDDRKDESPPYSRIFVVCGKHFKEEELRPHFEACGEIEDLYIPRDRNSGISKGVAYIKYAKTSSAASAIDELHLKTIDGHSKPLKVMVANNKHDSNVTNEDRYKRLFIKVPKQQTENDIRKHFSEFGRVESVRLHRDKETNENKGFAYVQYKSFLDAARGFEDCDRHYRPMFATPKDELKRSRSSLDTAWMDAPPDNCNFPSMNTQFSQNSISSLIRTQPEGYNTVNVTCSPQVPQRHIERLFNIVPGVQQFQYSVDTYNGLSKALVTFAEPSAAAHAVERINNYEFPSGEIISVKPERNQLKKVANDLTNIVNDFKKSLDGGAPDLMQLAEAIAQASTLIKHATTVKTESNDYHDSHAPDDFWGTLPPPQPMLDFNARVAKRCFIVCKPQPPPPSALRDIFCRFGDLIDVSTFPNKTFGFAKFGSVRSADEAIRALNEQTVYGVRLKVMEADEKPAKDDDEVGRKRIRMESD